MSAKSVEITVLMPVYNARDFVAEAINSVLLQTYPDFEFLIINDGSTDDSENVIRSFSDDRIRYLSNEGNKGLIYTLNKGLELAAGKYIVRMDADDVCMPDRLQKQIAAFRNDTSLVLCASNYFLLGVKGSKGALSAFHGNELKAQLLFASSISHPTVMMLNPHREYGISYHPEFPHCEDYRMWTELASKGNFQMLEDRLIRYRMHDKQITALYRQEQKDASSRIRHDFLEACSFQLSKDEKVILDRIGNHERFRELLQLQQAESILLKLQTQQSTLFSSNDFYAVLRKNWLDTCGNTSLGLRAYSFCLNSELFHGLKPSLRERLLLLAKCLLRKF